MHSESYSKKKGKKNLKNLEKKGSNPTPKVSKITTHIYCTYKSIICYEPADYISEKEGETGHLGMPPVDTQRREETGENDLGKGLHARDAGYHGNPEPRPPTHPFEKRFQRHVWLVL